MFESRPEALTSNSENRAPIDTQGRASISDQDDFVNRLRVRSHPPMLKPDSAKDLTIDIRQRGSRRPSKRSNLPYFGEACEDDPIKQFKQFVAEREEYEQQFRNSADTTNHGGLCRQLCGIVAAFMCCNNANDSIAAAD